VELWGEGDAFGGAVQTPDQTGGILSAVSLLSILNSCNLGARCVDVAPVAQRLRNADRTITAIPGCTKTVSVHPWVIPVDAGSASTGIVTGRSSTRRSRLQEFRDREVEKRRKVFPPLIRCLNRSPKASPSPKVPHEFPSKRGSVVRRMRRARAGNMDVYLLVTRSTAPPPHNFFGFEPVGQYKPPGSFTLVVPLIQPAHQALGSIEQLCRSRSFALSRERSAPPSTSQLQPELTVLGGSSSWKRRASSRLIS